MTASYRLIDYSLRPAKFAERKMLCELFARLKAFATLESYRYIGMGSIWFADCVLFHRVLGIRELVSIEKELKHEDRFHFNNPYRGIKIEMGYAADILPSLNWNNRAIIWLDYDDPLSPGILDDVRTVASRAVTGTAFAVSVQTEKLFDTRDIHDEPLHITSHAQFHDFFGSARTPPELTPSDLRGWRISPMTRQVVRGEIEYALQQTNMGRPTGQHLQFKQVAAFEYADGAKMTTIVGVFVDKGQNNLFEACGFRETPYYSHDLSAFRINVPLLTPREMRYLDRSLPCQNADELDRGPIPPSDAKNYAELYRFLPNFASFEP